MRCQSNLAKAIIVTDFGLCEDDEQFQIKRNQSRSFREIYRKENERYYRKPFLLDDTRGDPKRDI